VSNTSSLIPCPAETIAALQAFRKRHSEAQRLHVHYASQPTTVDFQHYRSVLKNKAIVDEAEKLFKDLKPITYDVGTHVKAIEAFEAKAVSPSTQLQPQHGATVNPGCQGARDRATH
jgi:F-type H+-transporting ATPase subunit d